MRLSAAERVRKSRVALVLDAPFFGVLASRLKIVEDPTCETMWTNSVEVGYNPLWVDEQSDAELKGTWVHEVFHVANGHCWRMGNRNPEDWNEAADRSIYRYIIAAGFILPEGVLDDKGFENMPAELIYEKIKKLRPEGQPQPNQQSKDGKSQDGQGQPQSGDNGQGDAKDGKSDGAGQDDGSDQGGKPSKKCAKGKGKGKGKAKDDGQAQGQGGASDSSGQQQSKAPPRAGEVRPAPEGVDQKDLEQEWAIAVNNAANFAASQGDVPGYLKEFLDEVRKPTVPWKDALWEFVQQSYNSLDFRWSRPNRNYLPSGLYLPSLVGEQMPPVVIGEDTSFSVYRELTLQFRGEMAAILEQTRPEKIYHLQADTRITKIVEMEPGDEFDNEVAGRGGTDFRPLFQWVEKEFINPACAIYMSDLDGPFPEREPDYPVLWLCPPGSPNPPWGRKLEMSFDQYGK
jgi:predicted metal-dependent peptidase